MADAEPAPRRKVRGAQSIGRAMDLVGLVAAAHESGVPLRELVQQSGLDRTTAWRIVASLVQQQLLEKDAHTGLYRLGLEAMAWGAACMARPPLVRACAPAMKALARQSGDNVFLVVRSGDYSHCLHLEEGAHAVRSFPLNVGGTRLLGMGVGSIALLATLAPPALAQHHTRHRKDYEWHEVGLSTLLRWAAQTRERGYSYAGADGVAGVGMHLRLGSCGDAAISILSPKARLPRSRVDALAHLLRAEVARLAPRLAAADTPGDPPLA